jgi:predicted component of type VI protein secretion system
MDSQLKEVTVLIRSRFECETKIKEYLKEFESRMSDNCPNVAIESHIQVSSGLANDQQWFPGADKQEM